MIYLFHNVKNNGWCLYIIVDVWFCKKRESWRFFQVLLCSSFISLTYYYSFFPLFCFLSQIDIFTKMSICKMSVFPSTLSLILSFSLSKQRNKMYLILIFEGPLLEFFLKPETKKKFHLFNNYGIVRHFGLFTYLLILP